MKLTLFVFGAALALSVVQATSQNASSGLVGKCEKPFDVRDKWVAEQLKKGNTPENLANIRKMYIDQGTFPDTAPSYQAILEILTGKPNKYGAQETANYKKCFDRFR